MPSYIDSPENWKVNTVYISPDCHVGLQYKINVLSKNVRASKIYR